MDKKESPKATRSLPNPTSSPTQRPNTPVHGRSGVEQTKSTSPPPLPSRPKNVGSSHTSYIPPTERPPTYSPGYREPEFLGETDDDDLPPALVPQQEEDLRHWTEKVPVTPYDNPYWKASSVDPWMDTDNDAWNENYGSEAAWLPGRGRSGYPTAEVKAAIDVPIDGRFLPEEINWWNAEARARNQRPGPGLLPPILADELHNPEHSLFSVTATSPSFASAVSGSQSSNSVSSTPAPPQTAAAASLPASSPPPSEDDVRTSVPHPNAYYCPKENGWVILSWKSSSVVPPLAHSFQAAAIHPLPDQTRRRKTGSCIGVDEQPFGIANKTHHFHKYEKAIDAHKLSPPLRRDDWNIADKIKRRRRTATVIIDEKDLAKLADETSLVNAEDATEEGQLLDLYICCQCSFYCVASGLLPGVISKRDLDELIRERKGSPLPGQTGEQALMTAFETILRVVENRLWRAENRLLKVDRPGFREKMGWNPTVKRIFEALGFEEKTIESELVLCPPATDSASTSGSRTRRKLLRAWVEVSAWIVDYRRAHATQLQTSSTQKTVSVQLEHAREMYQQAIGAHPDQIPRGELTGTNLLALQQAPTCWRSLGLTPTTYSPDLLAFGYLAQCRCDPGGTLTYFTQLSYLVRTMQDLGGCPPQLQELVAIEQSRGRFAHEDVIKAADTLGFGPEGSLRIEYDDNDVPEEFVENAWRERVKQSWRDPQRGSAIQREANEAFKILAEARGSTHLHSVWEASKDRMMSPSRAYDTLEIPSDVDDAMLITIFTMRLEEQPHQDDKMREALAVITEFRDSERLRLFLASGQDPGDIIPPTRQDLPRGLNQLGNTCYLNSLLQYFYTIKDLREAVLPMSKMDLKAIEDEKFSDDELKKHRVGGRLVTRREILRSKKFVNQLADLFFNMEYADAPSITPTIELAKLALVTSRDEEDEEADRGGTESSNDTDATLVDDGPSRQAVTTSDDLSRSSPPPTESVLGKRLRDDSMDVDVETGVPTEDSSRASSSNTSTEDKGTSSQNGGDVEMRDFTASSKPPPLPPRKVVETSSSVMMFGKQHDVAECMDNCMFQIETALLRFDGLGESQDADTDKRSVVKSLFYGKIKQRLTGSSSESQASGSSHEKQDLFSHLPVNVTDYGVDIYDGLSSYFDDIVDFEGEKHRMEVSLVDLPPLLQIQLQRVQFNRETLQPYKSQAYVKFGETIYMDRFVDAADPEKKAKSKATQAELTRCRERLRMLLEGKHGSHANVMNHTAKYLSRLKDLDFLAVEGLPDQLTNEGMAVQQEMDELRMEIDKLKDELEAIWRDQKEYAYELTSVFIHRGSSPSWGHYFFYSRHLPQEPDSWFKYNDSDVTVVPKGEVLADTTGSTANPYLLVFARKGSAVVDTVKRFDPNAMED